MNKIAFFLVAVSGMLCMSCVKGNDDKAFETLLQYDGKYRISEIRFADESAPSVDLDNDGVASDLTAEIDRLWVNPSSLKSSAIFYAENMTPYEYHGSFSFNMIHEIFMGRPIPDTPAYSCDIWGVSLSLIIDKTGGLSFPPTPSTVYKTCEVVAFEPGSITVRIEDSFYDYLSKSWTIPLIDIVFTMERQ